MSIMTNLQADVVDAAHLLAKNNMFSEKVQNYLEELFDFSILRKSDCLNTNIIYPIL